MSLTEQEAKEWYASFKGQLQNAGIDLSNKNDAAKIRHMDADGQLKYAFASNTQNPFLRNKNYCFTAQKLIFLEHVMTITQATTAKEVASVLNADASDKEKQQLRSNCIRIVSEQMGQFFTPEQQKSLFGEGTIEPVDAIMQILKENDEKSFELELAKQTLAIDEYKDFSFDENIADEPDIKTINKLYELSVSGNLFLIHPENDKVDQFYTNDAGKCDTTPVDFVSKGAIPDLENHYHQLGDYFQYIHHRPYVSNIEKLYPSKQNGWNYVQTTSVYDSIQKKINNDPEKRKKFETRRAATQKRFEENLKLFGNKYLHDKKLLENASNPYDIAASRRSYLQHEAANQSKILDGQLSSKEIIELRTESFVKELLKIKASAKAPLTPEAFIKARAEKKERIRQLAKENKQYEKRELRYNAPIKKGAILSKNDSEIVSKLLYVKRETSLFNELKKGLSTHFDEEVRKKYISQLEDISNIEKNSNLLSQEPFFAEFLELIDGKEFIDAFELSLQYQAFTQVKQYQKDNPFPENDPIKQQEWMNQQIEALTKQKSEQKRLGVLSDYNVRRTEIKQKTYYIEQMKADLVKVANEHKLTIEGIDQDVPFSQLEDNQRLKNPDILGLDNYFGEHFNRSDCMAMFESLAKKIEALNSDTLKASPQSEESRLLQGIITSAKEAKKSYQNMALTDDSFSLISATLGQRMRASLTAYTRMLGAGIQKGELTEAQKETLQLLSEASMCTKEFAYGRNASAMADIAVANRLIFSYYERAKDYKSMIAAANGAAYNTFWEENILGIRDYVASFSPGQMKDIMSNPKISNTVANGWAQYAKDYKSDIKENHYDELRRFALQFKKSDLIFSKGSTSYQALRQEINDLLENKTMPKNYNLNVKMARVMEKCDAYVKQHQGAEKLTNTQLQRLKTIRRISLLNDFVNKGIRVDSYQAKKEMLTEKIIDSMAIRMQNSGRDKDHRFRDMMLEKNDFYNTNVAAIHKNNTYKGIINGLLPGMDNIDSLLRQRGDDFIARFDTKNLSEEISHEAVEEENTIHTQIKEIETDEINKFK